MLPNSVDKATHRNGVHCKSHPDYLSLSLKAVASVIWPLADTKFGKKVIDRSEDPDV